MNEKQADFDHTHGINLTDKNLRDLMIENWDVWTESDIDLAIAAHRQAAIAAHSAFIREAAGRDDAQYAQSCALYKVAGKRYVGILDRKDGEAVIALVPFREDCPPLCQPDVDLIVSALNRSAMLDQIERTPDAQG